MNRKEFLLLILGTATGVVGPMVLSKNSSKHTAVTISSVLGRISDPIAQQDLVYLEQEDKNPAETVAPQSVEPISIGGVVHYQYAEADQSDLVYVGDFGARREFLHTEAAGSFHSLVEKARGEGIDLGIVSGFRSRETQGELWDRQIKRKGSEKAAAVWSAPPGYSEHHTGFAVDFFEVGGPALSPEFANTRAFRWLTQNAPELGFHLSFPEGNPQGVGFEPWHWRYKPS